VANPQLSDGFTMIPNELIEAIARTRFSGYESRVFWFIVRKTLGWRENGKQKKNDWISLSQFSLGTDLHKSHICRTINRLVDRNIITKTRNKRVSIQKDYASWKRNKK
jgi:phage replication O-like protein O